MGPTEAAPSPGSDLISFSCCIMFRKLRNRTAVVVIPMPAPTVETPNVIATADATDIDPAETSLRDLEPMEIDTAGLTTSCVYLYCDTSLRDLEPMEIDTAGLTTSYVYLYFDTSLRKLEPMEIDTSWLTAAPAYHIVRREARTCSSSLTCECWRNC